MTVTASLRPNSFTPKPKKNASAVALISPDLFLGLGLLVVCGAAV